MKKLPFFLALSCLLVINSFAQTRERRVFDNFDTMSGVRIVVPPAPQQQRQPPQPAPQNAPRKLVRKTGQQTGVGSVQDGLGLQNVSHPRQQQPSVNKLSMSAGNSLGGFTTGDVLIDSYIVESSIRYNIDPLLIYAQMHQESSFKRKAVSYKGASGLMQLMPATARRFGVTSIFDPKQNIDAGIKYMRWLLNTFNQDLRLALAGYNAGEGAVMKYGWQIPPYNETQEYVRRITARYNSIKNPNYIARAVKKVSVTEAAKLEQKESAPLTIYEPEPIMVRLPDGRMRLVSQ